MVCAKDVTKDQKINFIKYVFNKDGFNVTKQGFRFYCFFIKFESDYEREKFLNSVWRIWKDIKKEHIADEKLNTFFVSGCCEFLTKTNYLNNDKSCYTANPKCMKCGMVSYEIII